MKKSYMNRTIQSLFGYYPIEILEDDGIIKHSLPSMAGLKTAYEANLETAEDIREDVSTALGIEIETENAHIGALSPWAVTDDPSLRNHGKEYVSPPVTPVVARKMLIMLYSAFAKVAVSKRPDFSWRTSIHVHLNMRNEKVQSFLNLLLLYSLFEDSLFDFIGEERKKSNFCVPLQETDLSSHISRCLDESINIPDLISHWQKYSAFNPRPIVVNDHSSAGGPGSGKGTIEFRHLEGTYDLNKVINWLNLILSLQNASRNISLDDLRDRIMGIENRTQYLNILSFTFGPYANLLRPRGNFRDILYSSVAFAKECFSPLIDLKSLVSTASIRTTGLSEMVKIRSRFQKTPSEEDLLKARKNKKIYFSDQAMPFPPLFHNNG